MSRVENFSLQFTKWSVSTLMRDMWNRKKNTCTFLHLSIFSLQLSFLEHILRFRNRSKVGFLMDAWIFEETYSANFANTPSMHRCRLWVRKLRVSGNDRPDIEFYGEHFQNSRDGGFLCRYISVCFGIDNSLWTFGWRWFRILGSN